MVSELFRVFGPWVFVLAGMGLLLKYLVTDKLKAIMAKLEMVDDHEIRLTKVETVMNMNGCLGNDPNCRRRVGDV